ncbi:hypothetical protein O3G_MSEX010575 [Manduca sexta]|uniref:Uncharacterized protein n=1 Tax=Manduca sexta TaxID=7130 RepID=A0A921ZI67_MANSE|nr:hypothetical protein O3G_MSEX010575 [Manduca sexta]
MKFLTIFAAILSVALGYQASWTLQQLDEAISNPATDPSLVPYLEQALNEMMTEIFAGQQISAVSVSIPAVDLSTWSLPQLSAAIQNPTTDPALLPYLEQALNQMMEAMVSGVPVVAPVVVPAMDISSWTLYELNAAMSDPNTNPELMPYLEHALNEIMEALFSGHHVESVVVAIPAGLLPVETPVPIPVTPIQPIEVPVAPIQPIEIPVAPLPPVVKPPTPASPLVQIVVNVNQQEAENQMPEIVPVPVSPVEVVDVNPIDILHPVPAVLPVLVGAPVIGPVV